ncbi:MAG: hypothetical protein UE077_02290 [Ligilactobacillus ruminis]|nr:hypothetical protein [Ligilactobacillus ruminis]
MAKCSAAQPIQPSSQSNLPSNYFGLFPSWQAIVMHIKKGSILNGVDDDFSTPFFVFTKYLHNAIK